MLIVLWSTKLASRKYSLYEKSMNTASDINNAEELDLELENRLQNRARQKTRHKQ